MRELLFILFIIPLGVQAQAVSYAPTSIEFWGETEFTSVYSLGYKGVGFHFFDIRKTRIDEFGAPTVEEAFALSYKPLNIRDILKFGAIVFDQPFPTSNGRHLNVWIEAGIDISVFRLSYVHISNAYTGRLNHGIDFISLTLKLN